MKVSQAESSCFEAEFLNEDRSEVSMFDCCEEQSAGSVEVLSENGAECEQMYGSSGQDEWSHLE